MPPRTGLGKGLDALIPGGSQTATSPSGVTQVAVDLIQRNPRQPREKFDLEELENLATSIREHGVIQPLIVAPGKTQTARAACSWAISVVKSRGRRCPA